MSDTDHLVDPQDRSAVGWIIAAIILALLGFGGVIFGKPLYDKHLKRTSAPATMNTYHVCYIHRSTNGTFIRTAMLDNERMDTNFMAEAARHIHRSAGNVPSEILIISVTKLDPPK